MSDNLRGIVLGIVIGVVIALLVGLWSVWLVGHDHRETCGYLLNGTPIKAHHCLR